MASNTNDISILFKGIKPLLVQNDSIEESKQNVNKDDKTKNEPKDHVRKYGNKNYDFKNNKKQNVGKKYDKSKLSVSSAAANELNTNSREPETSTFSRHESTKSVDFSNQPAAEFNTFSETSEFDALSQTSDFDTLSQTSEDSKQNRRRNHKFRGKYQNQRNYSRNFHNTKRKIIGFGRLCELSVLQPDEILNFMSNSESGFEDLLNEELRPDQIFRIIKCISNACDSDCQEALADSLQTVLQTKFIDSLEAYINEMPNDGDEDRVASMAVFIRHILRFYRTVLTLLPVTTSEMLLKLFNATYISLRNLKYKREFQDVRKEVNEMMNLIKELENLQKGLKASEYQQENCMKKETRKEKQLQNKPNANSKGEKATNSKAYMEFCQNRKPRVSIKEVSLFPTVHDIQENVNFETITALNANGGYDNIEDFLYTQFMMLQEDFMRSLKDAINAVRTSRTSIRQTHINNVRIHQKTFIESVLSNGEGEIIYFDPDQKFASRVRWENSRRFMYATLLCLTCDYFQNIFFATVLKRNLNDLKEGKVVIQWVEGIEIPENLRKRKFLMLESEVFFDPYYYTMKNLQNLDDSTFPMKEYFISEVTHFRAPKYIQVGSKYKVDNFNLALNQTETWPKSSALNLDDSQYAAFRSALTREFVIIQGAPGTGKTFLGLKIIKTLLLNSSANALNSPILIISHTNHALDQFLEGLLTTTSNVVRIGRKLKYEGYKLSSVRHIEADNCLTKDMLDNAKCWNNYRCLQKAAVLGMTVGDAAKLKPVLQELKCKVVIFEEAADMMDAHIVVSLTNDCQHVILIGDHRKYEVSVENAHASKKCQEIPHSTFGRMLKKGLHCEVLNVQHRMRPEISKLITPAFYPTLQDHESVLKYEKIKGVDKNLYFINHNFPEEEDVGDLSGRKNTHEASFLIVFSCYLLMQGYTPDQITILTTYTGQMTHMCNERNKDTLLKNVKISAVQNYHGEENDIILLSLVRSNKDGSIGFLNNPSKMSMVLSRARKGFFITGNMDVLKDKSPLWESIEDTLRKQNSIGTGLPIRCQLHRDAYNEVQKADEFLKYAPLGGCALKCEVVMNCGHICPSVCHVQNRNHENIKCEEPCNRYPKNCELAHKCVKACWEDCGECTVLSTQMLPCGHTHELPCSADNLNYKCDVSIDVTLPRCQHQVKKQCHESLSTLLCTSKCENRLPCGHSCKLRCHVTKDPDHLKYQCRKPCVKINKGCKNEHMCEKLCYEECGDCMVQVVKRLKCGHDVEVACSKGEDTIRCEQLCNRTLPCGHVVEVACSKDITTIKCEQLCERKLSCGHNCHLLCREDCKEYQLLYGCREPCTRLNKNCKKDHRCTKECRDECSPCVIQVEKQLVCGHSCIMDCGKEIYQVRCEKPCNKTMYCGHKCQLKCWQACGNCQIKVPKSTPGCKHLQTVKCCETPDPKQCRGPCEKLLKCSHKCSGLCNEPCDTKPCSVMTLASVRPLCGHYIEIPCNVNQAGDLQPGSGRLLSYCRQPCGVCLLCEHTCKGTCGECMQGRIHKPCQEKCGKVLICGHSCDIPCSENCPPCNKTCGYKCKHSKCSRRCGEPCIPCMEPCEWRCPHSKCTKLCYQECNRKACTEPCKKNLNCGHPCIGFCGDPCPPLCKICNKEEVTTVFLGYEEEEDARFVYLEDCKHTVESQGLEMWLQRSDSEISMKLCPICKTPITKTMRYINLIKAAYKDVCKVKERVFGEEKIIEESKKELEDILNDLNPDVLTKYDIITGSTKYARMYSNLRRRSQPVVGNHRNPLSLLDINNLKIQSQFVLNIVKEIKDISKKLQPTVFRKMFGRTEVNMKLRKKITYKMDFMLSLVDRHDGKATKQKVEDMKLEYLHFQRVLQLCLLEDVVESRKAQLYDLTKAKYDNVKNILDDLKRYSLEKDRMVGPLLESLNSALKCGLNISLKEKQEILAAIGVTPGHWFKCPNGHIYVITECGGAMEEGRCNECGEKIGGTNHALLATNRLASEMDGARHAAWSNQQNLNNYLLD